MARPHRRLYGSPGDRNDWEVLIRKRRPLLTYANVVSTLCLFILLGGSGYAAVTLTGKRLKNRSVAGKKLKRNTVTGKEVRDRSLLAKDFKAGQLPAGPRGPEGSPGPKGDQGPRGPGATSFSTTAAQGSGTVVLATLDNNLTLTGVCGAASQDLNLHTTDDAMTFQGSGTQFHIGTLVSTEVNGGTTGIPGNGAEGNIDVIARGTASAKFARIDAHGSHGSPCTFWGMIIPSE